METEKCNALLCAIETGSISAAAEILGYTPSGISRSIAALEDELGISLLIRGKNGVSATKECEMLISDIRNMLSMNERLLQSAALIRGIERGTVIVGTAYPVYNTFLAEMIVSFRRLHPGISIRITEGTSTELCGQLAAHKLDLCIVSRRDIIPVFREMVQDSLCVWVNRNHPAVQKGIYAAADLEKDDFIQIYPGMETDNSIFLQKNHIRPSICASTSDIYAAYSMVEAGLGVALINRIHAQRWEGGAVPLPLDIDASVDIGLAAAPHELRAPAAEAFLSYISEELKGRSA